MSVLDDRIREVVHTIGQSAPNPPALREDTVRTRPTTRRVSGPTMAIVSFVVVIGVFAGAGFLFGGQDQTPATNVTEPPSPDVTLPESTIPSGGAVEVRHQVVLYESTADLSCDDAVGAGTTKIEMEVWADFTGGRFRQQATYADGSTRIKLAFGDINYPEQTFGQGQPGLIAPACGEDLVGGDPTAGPQITFFNPPVESPNTQSYRELGTVVPGDHQDSQGRPAMLYREVIDGYASYEDGVEHPVHQVTEWYVDGATGDVLETVFSQSIGDRSEIRTSFVVLSDETSTVDGAIFEPAGYQLEWAGDDGEQGPRVDGQSIEPSTTLGPDFIWPDPSDPADPETLGRRFAEEILGWDQAVITPDPDASPQGPTRINISDDRDHDVDVLATPTPDGWGLVQIGDPSEISSAPLGYASINPNLDVGATTVVIHAAVRDGSTLAWRADLTTQPGIVVLTGPQMGDIRTLLITYQDENGRVIAVNGGQY